jgi:hypothetical protein
LEYKEITKEGERPVIWYEIFLSKESVAASNSVKLVNAVGEIILRSGFPKELALFRKKQSLGDLTQTYYLPESASRYCADVLKLYNARVCDNPGPAAVVLECGEESQMALLESELASSE